MTDALSARGSKPVALPNKSYFRNTGTHLIMNGLTGP